MSYAKKVAAGNKPARKKEPNAQVALRVRRSRTNKLIKEAAEIREGERKCTVIKQNGQRCGKYAIKGGFVCMSHGGSAPQVRAKANKRLLAMVEPALVRLSDLMHQDMHPPTALGAVRTVLERAGSSTPIGALNKNPEQSKPSHVVNIGIAIGGITPEKMREMMETAKVTAQKMLEDGNTLEGETVEDNGEEDH